MGTGFEKLHIALATGLLSLGFAAGGALSRARAATVTLPVTVTTGGATWDIGNDTDGAFDGDGLGITDATLQATPTDLNDAYDGAFVMAVNGVVFEDPTGVVDLTGTTLTSNALTLSGLQTQVQYFFSSTLPVVRALYSFTNPSPLLIEATVSIGHNLGSDSNTVIEATSSGDTALNFADQWVVTSDQGVGPDPLLTFFRSGAQLKSQNKKGAPLVQEAPGVHPNGNEDEYADFYLIKVSPGKTVRILLFGGLSLDVAGATNLAATFADPGNLVAAGLLAGLTKQQAKEIINHKIKVK